MSSRARVGAGAGFWVVATAFLVAMCFSTIPTPLYPLYQRRDGFSTFTVTVVFAMYAVGVVLSLLFLGHVSDWVGRRRVILAALACEVVSAVVFLTWSSVPALLVARLVCGLGIGMLTATATAHLQELHAAARPDAGRGRFEVVSTAANLGGLGLGPIVAGALAEYVAAPLRTPYLLLLGLLLLVAFGVSLVPETVVPQEVRPPYRPQRISAGWTGSNGNPRAYVAAAASAFMALSLFGMFTSVSPGFIAGTLHHSSRLLAGAAAFLVFTVAAIAQSVSGRASTAMLIRLGLTLAATGLAVFVLGVAATSLAGFLLGGAVAGVGAGLLFKSAIGVVAAMAPAGQRGEALAGLFFLGYLGLIIPTVGIGVAERSVAPATALYGFAAGLLVILAGVAVLTRRAA